jgi:acetyltransferase
VTVQIQRCSARRAAEQRKALVALLLDAVASDASVSFLAPLLPEVAEGYWEGVETELAHGHRELLLAERDGVVVGAVQLELAAQPNARHRALVAQLLVHASARRQGIGRTLMREVEELAKSHGRTLLVLDTREGDAAEQLYLALGYLRAGRIPGYARSSSGALEATVLFYRELGPPSA